MIRTIVADDEAWVCKLITGMIDWTAYGFEMIGNAYDGVSLYRLIEEQKPDLVISDIRMPGMDGLSVIKKAKDAGLDTKFIIISGYSDFEYAKTAIHMGVLGYLLKPVESEELTGLLCTVKKDFFSGSKDVFDDSALKKQLKKSQLQYLEYYLYHYLFESDPSRGDLCAAELNRQFGTSFTQGCYRINILILDPHHDSCAAIYDNVLAEVSSLAYSMFRGTFYETVVIRSFHSVLFLVNYPPEKRDMEEWVRDDFFHAVFRDVADIGRFDATLGVGAEEIDATDLPRSLAAAQDAIHARVKLGVGKMIDLSGKKYDHLTDAELILPQIERKLIEHVTRTAPSDEEQLTHELFSVFEKNDSINPGAGARIAAHVVELAVNTLSAKVRMTFNKDHPPKQFRDAIDSCASLGELKTFVIRLLDDISKSANSESGKTRSVIDMIKAYIDEHYNEDIKLNDIAKYIYMNPNYVSDLFKSSTGTNFSKYLILKRIDMAKIYLMDARYHINDVACMVGYNDAKYFAKLFKTYVGVSPVQYRKMFC